MDEGTCARARSGTISPTVSALDLIPILVGIGLAGLMRRFSVPRFLLGGICLAFAVAAAIDGLVLLAFVIALLVLGYYALVVGLSEERLRRYRFRRAARSVLRSSAEVQVDDWGVRRIWEDGTGDQLAWDDVDEVDVVVVRWPGFRDDVIVLRSGANDVVLPRKQTALDFVADLRDHLPGFDIEPASDALRSSRKGIYTCWRRTTTEPPPA
jgi:hypothetical protein